jgi:plasmid segregation protein ParM
MKMERIVAGNDIGYGYTKAVVRKGARAVKRVVIESLIGPAIDVRYHVDLMGNGNPHELETNGEAWFFGQDARMQSPFTISPRSRDRDAETMRVLMLAALTRAGVTSAEVQMVTGLPVAWYEDKDELTTTLRGLHTFHLDDESGRVDVTHLLVVPQPFGSFVTAITDAQGKLTDPDDLARGKVSVVDIGMHTSDFALFDTMRYREPLSGSIPLGMARYYELIQRRVESEHGLQISLEEAREACSTFKVRDHGDSVEVGSAVESAWNSISKRIVGKAQTLWDDEARTIDRVLITGGGAVPFERAIKARFPQAVKLDEPQMANAEGFLRYALRKFG